MGKKASDIEFTQREIRQDFNIGKTQMFRYFNDLQELQYIHKTHIGSRNTQSFQISYWDNIEKLRSEIREYLNEQIKSFKNIP